MSNDKQFKDFYTLELKILEENEKQRLADINARKNMNKSKTSSSTYNRRNIISKERLIIVVTIFILSLLLFPIAQNYLIKSNISNIIQENDEVMKNIVDDLIFDKDTHQINNLPKFTSIKQDTHQIQIDIGYTGKKIVNGIGYIYLSPKQTNDKNMVTWECTAYGSGIREDYLPNNCVIKKL